MDSSSQTISTRAKELFAGLVARHEGGEAIDWELEFEAVPQHTGELRVLHARWVRVEELFTGLVATPERVASAARDLAGTALDLDEATKQLLTAISAPDRGARRYEELDRIARGGMGVVTRVRDRDLERELALKTMRVSREGSSLPDGRALRRFLQEARIAARLEHPGILPVHDVGIDARGRVYFTMPLVRGRTLAEVLDRPSVDAGAPITHDWTRERILEVVLKVCDALAYAHAQGIVHRDLKPANILVGRFGESYVTDWGLARLLDAGEDGGSLPAPVDEEPMTPLAPGPPTAQGSVLGTVHYMAPEQARGDRTRISPRTDIFALGAVLYHVLSGRMPHAGADEEEALERVRRGATTPLSICAPLAPEELVSICEKAMAREPVDRYRDCAEMAIDLRAYMEGRVVRAHERGAWPELRKWFGRNRAVALATSVAALATLAGLTASLLIEARARREILRLADAQRLEDLQSRADSLWPALPEQLSELEAWDADARALLDNLPVHQRALEKLRADVKAGTGAGRFVFDTPEEQWRHDTLARLVEDLERWKTSDAGASPLASVEQRLAFARGIEERSLVEPRDAWTEAGEAIARSPKYGGLHLAPQLGLVPLGPDPDSGLWEFAHLASGEPARRRLDGRLEVEARSGIVLVLVPGGRFTMGSTLPVRLAVEDVNTNSTPERGEVDLLARTDETPPCELVLRPYFIAKYETTQAQWSRLTHRQPSGHVDATGLSASGPQLPVETISWTEADVALRHAALDLPTEAQWECAARAGTTTRFWCGREASTLVGRVNAGWGADGKALHEGEYTETVAVDGLAANPWGLFDVSGNVAEWVEDAYGPSLSGPRREGDGLLLRVQAKWNVARGGSFASPPRDLRSAARRAMGQESRSAEVGVRAARRVLP